MHGQGILCNCLVVLQCLISRVSSYRIHGELRGSNDRCTWGTGTQRYRITKQAHVDLFYYDDDDDDDDDYARLR
jgi:hypothetical protein